MLNRSPSWKQHISAQKLQLLLEMHISYNNSGQISPESSCVSCWTHSLQNIGMNHKLTSRFKGSSDSLQNIFHFKHTLIDRWYYPHPNHLSFRTVSVHTILNIWNSYHPLCNYPSSIVFSSSWHRDLNDIPWYVSERFIELFIYLLLRLRTL